ncbi:MAG: hypothetical protein OXI08_06670 [Cyanobacteria bacterium MAG IRC4_bin_6]|nr:hypothetical protein [Cyanobacteria bacterium MAG IRC4_bin_6]
MPDAIPSNRQQHQYQLETILAYGFPAFRDRLTITPALSLALSADSATYGLASETLAEPV